jgi:NAD(P)H-dependent flavin oxidoreductase YrpB (nitropropane dioxygenase family)
VRVFTLGGWLTPRIARLREELGLTLLVSVNAPTVARMVLDQPLDALIVQGNESGGANGQFGTRQLFDLIAPTTAAPVVLAGGQWDGADLHRGLLLGAAGVQLGTRFFLCEESPLHPTIKQQLLQHNLKRPLTTALTPVTDTLQMRFVHWKPYKAALESGELQATFQDKERVFQLSAAFFRPQERPLLVYAGAAVYKLRAIQPAAEVLRELVAEYRALSARPLPAL